MAELDGKPADMPVVQTIPDRLRDAATPWLKVRRPEMSQESFKVVPSKIERFLDVIGDLRTIQLDASRWSRRSPSLLAWASLTYATRNLRLPGKR